MLYRALNWVFAIAHAAIAAALILMRYTFLADTWNWTGEYKFTKWLWVDCTNFEHEDVNVVDAVGKQAIRDKCATDPNMEFYFTDAVQEVEFVWAFIVPFVSYAIMHLSFVTVVLTKVRDLVEEDETTVPARWGFQAIANSVLLLPFIYICGYRDLWYTAFFVVAFITSQAVIMWSKLGKTSGYAIAQAFTLQALTFGYFLGYFLFNNSSILDKLPVTHYFIVLACLTSHYIFWILYLLECRMKATTAEAVYTIVQALTSIGTIGLFIFSEIMV